MIAEDIDILRKIHEKFYGEEFDIDVFNQQFLALFTVVDGDSLVTIGGIRPLMEAVIVTNKDLSPRTRILGLNEMLSMFKTVVQHHGLDSFHAFVQDENWLKQLKTAGFKPVIGSAVHYSVRRNNG
jgi:hypothetical protein